MIVAAISTSASAVSLQVDKDPASAYADMDSLYSDDALQVNYAWRLANPNPSPNDDDDSANVTLDVTKTADGNNLGVHTSMIPGNGFAQVNEPAEFDEDMMAQIGSEGLNFFGTLIEDV